jgi:hypothetical protein
MRPEKVQQRQLGSQPLYALRSPSACTADRTAAGLPVRLDRCWRDSRVETMANVGVDGGGRKGRCRKSGPWRCPAYGGGADEPTGHRSSARLRKLHHTNVVVNSGRPSGAVGPPTIYSVIQRVSRQLRLPGEHLGLVPVRQGAIASTLGSWSPSPACSRMTKAPTILPPGRLRNRQGQVSSRARNRHR